MMGRNNRRKGVGSLTQLLGAESVDTREYHGHAGDLIRIEPFTLFKVDKVLVAIRAEKAGLIEHGLAKLEPRTDQWLYTATSDNPETDDWSVTVTAVRAPGPALRTPPKKRCWYGSATFHGSFGPHRS